MPDVNHTQGLSNDAPRDPLDDLIAPILGRDVTPNRHTDSNQEVIRMAAPISWHQHEPILDKQCVLVISTAGRNALHRKRATTDPQAKGDSLEIGSQKST